MDLSEHIESRSHSKTSQIDIKTNDQVQFPVTENIEFEQDGYKICITHDLIDSDWDAFLKKIPCANPVQTSTWGFIKSYSGWKPIRLLIKERNTIIAGVQILTRPLPFLGLIGYASRAPLYQKDDIHLLFLLVNELEKIAIKYRLKLLAIQMAADNPQLESLLHKRAEKSSILEIAPMATIKIDLTHDQNFLLALMKRRNRRSIHKSMRSDLIVREGTEEDLPDFYQLYLKTSQRQKFIPFKLDYFRNLWCVLKPFNSVQLFVAEYGGEKISALMSITFGNTLYTKHIGWSGKCSEFKPNHAVYWAALLWAKSKNYQYCDLDGIDIKTAQLLSKGKTLKVNQMQNPTFFKTGFGGELLLFPQTYVFVYNIFFRLACKLYLAKIFPTYFISRMMNIVRVSR